MRRSLILLLTLGCCTFWVPPAIASSPADQRESASATTTDRAVPRLRTTRPVSGLSKTWDVQAVGGGLLVTERDTARLWFAKGGQRSQVRFPSRTVWVSGETGLMSLAIDPNFAKNHRIYTCQGGFTANGTDVRVMAWRMADDFSGVTSLGPLLTRLPTSSGRHGGCRLLIDQRNGSLWVGTGDAAIGTNPRNLASLGGKTLRLNRFNGKPWKTNPYRSSARRTTRYVVSRGHRNIQGLAQRRNGTIWAVEHGSYRDDEVNLIRRRGDYGWNPVPGYNESVPMTDQRLPGKQRAARWRSGEPTLATSGAAWVRGKRWGALNGTLAVAALKSQRVLFLKFDAKGRLKKVRSPRSLRRFGRLRSITAAPNGSLLITTDNGTNDGVIRVSPR